MMKNISNFTQSLIFKVFASKTSVEWLETIQRRSDHFWGLNIPVRSTLAGIWQLPSLMFADRIPVLKILKQVFLLFAHYSHQHDCTEAFSDLASITQNFGLITRKTKPALNTLSKMNIPTVIQTKRPTSREGKVAYLKDFIIFGIMQFTDRVIPEMPTYL